MSTRESERAGAGAGPAPRLALRPKEAAKAIGISERLLWSLTNAGEIPHVRIGRAVVYPIPALEEWLKKRLDKKKSGNRFA
ncbi:MAG: helix-turn-helix domain-containing protein [Planctomycetes bacterium]|nr:helix-turn-helix domain-containing protein [Planctomycetota bacterium]